MRNPKNLHLNVTQGRQNVIVPDVKETVKITDFKATDGEQEEKTEKVESTTADEKNLPPVSFFKLFKYATKWEILLMFIGILASVGTGLCQPVNIFIFGDLIGSMVEAAMKGAIGNVTGDGDIDRTVIMDAVIVFAVGNCIIGAIMLVLSYTSVMLFNYTAHRQVFRIRSMYLRSALNQEISWYDEIQSGDIASRLTEDITKFEEGIGEKFVIFFHSIVSFVGCIALAFYKGWKLTLVCFASVPVTMAILGTVGTIISRLTRKEVDVYANAGSIAEEAISAIRTVFAFGGQKLELKRYKENLLLAYKDSVKKGLMTGIGFGTLWFCIYASYALSFWYGVTLILHDKYLPMDEQIYTSAVMITVFFSVMSGSMNVGNSAPFIEAFGTSRAAAANVFSVIERKSAIDSLSAEGSKPTDIDGTIDFRNVFFEYPTRTEVPVLRGVDFSIKRGETVALVGSSGCGKSTCVQLVQRFYDPREGQILLDGYDLRDLNVAWLRSHMGVVGQEPVLFDTTVAENIRYGNIDATTEDIVRAAKEANAHNFIMKLPLKYETLVGEGGTQISGGQKQRIAIARALVRDPEILLLDEATSALDTRSESKVQSALDKASRGRTTIIVAHRLTTIRGADKIIVLSDGRVAEQGDHDSLMALNGQYHALFTAQISEVGEPFGANVRQDRELSIDEDEDDESLAAKSEPVDDERANEMVEKISMWTVLGFNKPEWPHIIVACLTAIIVGCSMPLFAVLFGDILGVLSSTDDDEVRRQTDLYCLYFVITGTVIGLASFLQFYLFGIAGECLTMRLRGLAFEAMLKQEVAWFDERANGTGALCAKLSSEAAAVQGATGQRVGTVVQSIATLTLAIGLAIYYEWRLGLVGMAFMPLILVTTYTQGRVMKKETFNYHKNLESSTKLAVEAVANIRTVVGLGREETFHKAYVTAMTPVFHLAKRNTHYRGLVFALARSIVFFAYSACMYYGGYLIENEGFDYANVFKVAQSLIMGTFMVANSLAFAPNFQKGMIAAGKIFALLQRVPKVRDPIDATEDEWNPEGDASYRQVVFEYPTRPGIRVLQGLNLDVARGRTVALIGPSGCGKSTIVQLLQRFYDPDSGVVQLGGRDVSGVAQASLRMQMGLVSQEPTLFARTVAENIAYGDTTREVPMSEIIAAARKANVHDFVGSLPLGYETKLGNRGTQLSGGQKQRVAIARALVRNPKILLLDEATSALDMESEKVVQAALDDAKEGRTCITIAHRLSTVQDADTIFVIDRGVVVESGTHAELVKNRDLYYKLLTLKNERR